MKRLLAISLALFSVFFVAMSCQSAGQQNDRPAAAAGSFYPADPTQLTTFVDAALSRVQVQAPDSQLLGIVVPHAGYLYSGPVAAYSYALLKGRKYKRVVLVGPSHVEAFGYTSVFNGESYVTPLGKVAVDREFARKLADGGRTIKLSSTGHAVHERGEHSLEVEIPFLQRTLGDFKIVPVIMGDQSYRSSRELGVALAKLLRHDDETLLVASSDLSHYHTYDQAVLKDRSLLNGITQDDFLTLSRNLESDVWEACGGAPMVAVMIAAQRLGSATPRLLKYANSGDVTGDRTRVVGYAALAFLKGPVEPTAVALGFTDAEKTELLSIARQSVEKAVREHKAYEPPKPSFETLQQERAVFVTLTRKGELRGCIGYTVPNYPLYLAVRDVAAMAALRDPRFPPVRPEELKDIKYEVSVLSPFHYVLDPATVRIGQHGLVVKHGGDDGLLLPQVPVEQRWDLRTFLQEASRKAGLSADAWQDENTDLFTFTATVFSDQDAPSVRHP